MAGDWHAVPRRVFAPHWSAARAAEIAALRSQLNEMASELDRVSRSPVWRTVKDIEGARRILMRAAAMAFALLGGVRERKQEVVRLRWQFPSLFRRYGMR